jgi:Leucine-rich repeat (LRR) protein
VRSIYTLLLLTILSFHVTAQEGEIILNDSTYIYRSLDEASKNPDRVFRLNLSKRKLDSFPDQILQFKNLIELDLTRNKIEELPAGIGDLIHLQRLKLGNNALVHLPPEIGNLKKLVFLELSRNQLEDLPPTIGGLTSLEILELWDNELKDVPDEISELQNLKMLELRGILFTEEQQQRIDSLVVKSAKIHLSPACNCKN